MPDTLIEILQLAVAHALAHALVDTFGKVHFSYSYRRYYRHPQPHHIGAVRKPISNRSK